ncbi:2-oxo-4-hydroxy-4-carboxy-5-ureidoimidazoline decarboxylase [Agromyces mediolanus]|uniref:2-oxo-4-hydroxy-4-carboxy-5-ureidoimidazoline decarboxylase n=1 Tax=Agromyces mediolanus TaxID=41986 RepID=UPI001E4A76F8|nr:2-oxo-4-hydroxy-4-carboxy-5-ureidoimidazoline decarboxylase [Agromyces mediolanus]MCD1570640.1 2-oxo-4-hydroxy-4-carboxy-5-ureidoimidazoline decarboxylase [Agromyces mediolanus]
MKLEQFNGADRREAIELLRPCIDVPRWCDELADGRPYASVAALLAEAERAASPFTAEEVERALGHHPRIGERAAGASREATLSRSEQAGVDPADAELAERLTAGNLAYEERFGRVFLIRAAGRSAAEILAALTERLGHDEAEEDEIVAAQLREIALLRLEGAVTA